MARTTLWQERRPETDVALPDARLLTLLEQEFGLQQPGGIFSIAGDVKGDVHPLLGQVCSL